MRVPSHYRVTATIPVIGNASRIAEMQFAVALFNTRKDWKFWAAS
jgi:hypothetical protein